MAKEGFLERVKKELGIKSGDTILHIYDTKTNFSKFFSDSVGDKGKVYAIDVSTLVKKSPKKNIQFATVKDNLNLEKEILDLIFLEDTIYKLTDFYDSLAGIKKYLSSKGKIVINQKKEPALLHYFKRKRLKEGTYDAGFRLKNRFNLNNGTSLEVFERE